MRRSLPAMALPIFGQSSSRHGRLSETRGIDSRSVELCATEYLTCVFLRCHRCDDSRQKHRLVTPLVPKQF